MSESRVLVLDADAERAARIASVLEFLDLRPVVVPDIGEYGLEGRHPHDWVAVVLGDVPEPAAWREFATWLAGDPLHPPILALPMHAERESTAGVIHPCNVWSVDAPLKHRQFSELLRRASLKRLDQDLHAPNGFDDPTGGSPPVRALRQLIEQVASFDTTVLLLGESGTGKEVAARAIHRRSQRRQGSFVAINCGAIPPDLLESELFGHEKGAFTGALTARKGRFEMAEGGTLLLDEIGDMSLPMQVKLLRVLQERSFERVGGNQTIRCNVRVIAATHRNLEAAILDGRFREDLFYRLNVFPIDMPPLRERIDDLDELTQVIAGQLARNGRGTVAFSAEAIAAMRRHTWPGNVRELTNLVERMAVLHPGSTVRALDLPQRYRPELATPAPQRVETPTPAVAAAATAATSDGNPAPYALPDVGRFDLRQHMADVELGYIRSALDRTGGVVAHAAELLGLRRTTLVEKLRKYGIERAGESELGAGVGAA